MLEKQRWELALPERGARFEHQPGASRIIWDVFGDVRCEFCDGFVPFSSPGQYWAHPLVDEAELPGGSPYSQEVPMSAQGRVLPSCLSMGQKFLSSSPTAGCVSKVSSVAPKRARYVARVCRSSSAHLATRSNADAVRSE